MNKNLVRFGRFFRTHSTTNAINISGIIIGFVAFFLIALYLVNESSYDTHYEKPDEIYRVEMYQKRGDSPFRYNRSAPLPLSKVMQDDIPEVKSVTRFLWLFDSWLFVKGDESYESSSVCFADPTVFDVFDYQVLEGNLSSEALDAPNEIVLTESLAQKFFGTESALGKTLERNDKLFTVTAVIKDIPENSSLKFEALVSSTTPNWLYNTHSHEWHKSVLTYVRLNPNSDKKALAKKLSEISNSNLDENHKDQVVDIVFTPLRDVNIYRQNGEIPYKATLSPALTLLLLLASLILAITLINYTNIIIAQIFERKQFYGIHKLIGSDRLSLMRTFLFNYGILYFIGVFIAILLVFMSLPCLNSHLNLHMTLSVLNFDNMLLGVLFAVGVFIIASLYPLRQILKLDPIVAVREKVQKVGGVNIRRLLVGAQFFITFLIVALSFIIDRQSVYLINKEIGIATNNLLVVKLDNLDKSEFKNNIGTFKDELEKLPEIEAVSINNGVPGDGYNGDVFWLETDNTEDKFGMKFICADPDYIKVMGLELIAGENFSKELRGRSRLMILTESTVKRAGFTTPEEAIGKRFMKDHLHKYYTVIGVIKDFAMTSYEGDDNLGTLIFDEHIQTFTNIKYVGSDHLAVLDKVETLWNSLYENKPFRYYYVNEKYQQRFAYDIQKARVTSFFSVIAVILSAIGLFGMAYFTILKREKEFCVRKINGAAIGNVLYLVFSEFSKLILLVCIFAIPVAYWLGLKVLEEYASKISLSWWIFTIPLALILLISIVSVLYHALKLAYTNPAKILRDN